MTMSDATKGMVGGGYYDEHSSFQVEVAASGDALLTSAVAALTLPASKQATVVDNVIPNQPEDNDAPQEERGGGDISPDNEAAARLEAVKEKLGLNGDTELSDEGDGEDGEDEPDDEDAD